MKKKTVRDIDLAGKTVLVRVDYNVPVEKGKVGDTLRIESSFPTLKYLLDQKCKLVLISHLGRPDGKVKAEFSLKPVAAKAAELLKHPIEFVNESVGPAVKAKVAKLKPGQILLLENLRFHPEEEANSATFAEQLAELGEVFVQDGFAVVHRAHASTAAITKYLPSVAGLLLEKEVDTITKAVEEPTRPLLAVVGGAKVSDKIDVLSNLIKKVDILLIGGAMANTFLAAEGFEVGKSVYEKDQIKTAQKIKAQAEEKGLDLVLPQDVVVTDKVADGRPCGVVDPIAVRPEDIIVDVGPRTVTRALKSLGLGGTVIWNGPIGITEVANFAKGSLQLATQIIASNATSLIGGGDTAAFVDGAGLHNKFGFVSTGGGASLDLMAGKKLPGVEALQDK